MVGKNAFDPIFFDFAHDAAARANRVREAKRNASIRIRKIQRFFLQVFSLAIWLFLAVSSCLMLESFVHSSGVSAMVVLMLPCAAEWYQMFLQWQYAPAGIHWRLIWSHCAACCCGVGTIVCLGIHGCCGNEDYLAACAWRPSSRRKMPWRRRSSAVIRYFRVKWCLRKALVHLQRYRGRWVNRDITGILYMPYEKVSAALYERRRELAFRLDRADERRWMVTLETLLETWHRRVSKLDHFLATQLPPEMQREGEHVLAWSQQSGEWHPSIHVSGCSSDVDPAMDASVWCE